MNIFTKGPDLPPLDTSQWVIKKTGLETTPPDRLAYERDIARIERDSWQKQAELWERTCKQIDAADRKAAAVLSAVAFVFGMAVMVVVNRFFP